MNIRGGNNRGRAIAACWLGACAFAASLFGESVELRTTYTDNSTSVRTVELEKISDSLSRLTIRAADIPANVRHIDAVAAFAKARKGDAGYWVNGRGTYGEFTQENGRFSMRRNVIPVFGMKTDKKTFWANVRTFRFDYAFCAEAKGGVYEAYPRFLVEEVRKWFPLYNDIVVEFNTLTGGDADYSGMGRGYRQFQLENRKVRTIKDRMKEFPDLEYLTESMVIRIQTHAAKPIAEKPEDFTRATEYPVAVHMPFGVAEEFVQAIKNAGVDKATICSAGWNFGGYDGRTPQHLPVEPACGGEEALRRLIQKTQSLGFQMTAHATCTDAYTVSPMWSREYIGKRKDGSLDAGGLWAGGQSYNVCQKRSWELWLPKEMEQIRALGFKGPHYIDVYSATYPNRCCDTNHPATPEEMAECQNKILARSKQLFGGAASESGFDHVAGNIDYINYVERVMKEQPPEKFPMITGYVPLWEIVYHGIILYNPDRLTQNHTRGKCLYKIERSGDPRWMEGDGIVDPKISLKIVEFGGRPIFYTYKFADVPRIKAAYDEFQPVKHLQKELMHSHEKIADQVFLVKYEDGSEIVCNYAGQPFAYRGRSVKPVSYELYAPEK